MNKVKIILLGLAFIIGMPSLVFAMTTTEEKRLFQDIAEIKATLKVFMHQVDKRFEQIDKRFEEMDKRFEKRFEQIDKRFEQIDKRFEQIDKRFDQINNRFEDFRTFLWMIVGIFTTLTGVVIAFAYWDRRTVIKAAVDETISKIEKVGRLKDLIYALRELAKTDKKLAEVLRSFNLL
ncbi:hypothetical protein SAMN04488516_10122 [Desulfonauticus submarinus]|uniref:Uncharacterized protein n=1 Tax=Desulfonauticus submarinus TaxID=206665 RepID=A0A1G9ZHC5_9BACT|nr:hypothetical protein [Desulfonauticus submarinus]SDN20565.1 hypothetical protein SAMN04488516_10122 [Desulfonauticus submarinus]